MFSGDQITEERSHFAQGEGKSVKQPSISSGTRFPTKHFFFFFVQSCYTGSRIQVSMPDIYLSSSSIIFQNIHTFKTT